MCSERRRSLMKPTPWRRAAYTSHSPPAGADDRRSAPGPEDPAPRLQEGLRLGLAEGAERGARDRVAHAVVAPPMVGGVEQVEQPTTSDHPGVLDDRVAPVALPGLVDPEQVPRAPARVKQVGAEPHPDDRAAAGELLAEGVGAGEVEVDPPADHQRRGVQRAALPAAGQARPVAERPLRAARGAPRPRTSCSGGAPSRCRRGSSGCRAAGGSAPRSGPWPSAASAAWRSPPCASAPGCASAGSGTGRAGGHRAWCRRRGRGRASSVPPGRERPGRRPG